MSSRDWSLLWFFHYLLRFHLTFDWPRNKHFRNFLWCHSFTGKTITDDNRISTMFFRSVPRCVKVLFCNPFDMRWKTSPANLKLTLGKIIGYLKHWQCDHTLQNLMAYGVAQNSYQHFPRRRFWLVIITTLYQLMLQSWYQKTTQSLVNTLVLFSWHNRLP